MLRSAVAFTLFAATALVGCSSGSEPDTTPPAVASVNPASGATGVALDADVIVTFSERIDAATVTPASVSLRLGAVTVPTTQTVENNNSSVRLDPVAGLGNNTTYTVSVTGAVTDVAGNPLSAPASSNFTTATASASVNDPTGDTYGTIGVQHDITTFSSQQGSITIVIQFNGPISRSSANVANSVGGYLDIDVDQNGATGGMGATDAFRPDAGSTGLGVEFLVDLFDNPDGSLSVRENAGGTEVGTVMPTFGATSITFTIPQSMIGSDDGNVDLATVIGSLDEPTDIAPNTGHMTLGVSGLPAAALTGSRQLPGAASRVPSWGWGRR